MRPRARDLHPSTSYKRGPITVGKVEVNQHLPFDRRIIAPLSSVAFLGLRCYATSMTIKARVTAGRLVVDEPTDLPEGAELDLLPLDPGDWLDDADRAALHEALRQSDADVSAGRLVDITEILDTLRSR
jgi:hypothetical protein